VTRRGLLLFVTLGIVWGIPYALIKIAVAEVSPTMLILARTAIAAAVLLPVAAARGELLRVLPAWRPLLAYTVAEIVLPWYFLNTAEQRLPSSTTGLLIATVPLAGVLVGVVLGPRAHLSAGNWLGIALGMAGVAAIVGLDVGGTDLPSAARLVVVALGYALGPAILARWMPTAPGIGVAAVSLAFAALVYTPVVAVTDAWPTAWPSGPAVASIVTLALVCSAAAFTLLVALVAEIGPMRATAVTYLNPAVAVVVGVLLLDEQVTAWTFLGFALVIAGSFLVTRRGHEEVVPGPVDRGLELVGGAVATTVDEGVRATPSDGR
jgi:drug/metabolite transporter (DMT)-like permease